MKAISSTTFRQDLDNIVEEVIMSSEPIQITSEKGSVILVPENEWKSIQETMYLLSIPNMRESILEGEKEPLEECMDEKDLPWNKD